MPAKNLIAAKATFPSMLKMTVLTAKLELLMDGTDERMTKVGIILFLDGND